MCLRIRYFAFLQYDNQCFTHLYAILHAKISWCNDFSIVSELRMILPVNYVRYIINMWVNICLRVVCCKVSSRCIASISMLTLWYIVSAMHPGLPISTLKFFEIGTNCKIEDYLFVVRCYQQFVPHRPHLNKVMLRIYNC